MRLAIEAGERVVFFGDSHLAPSADPGAPPDARQALVADFLDEVGAQATRLICVGDLFDYWLGPEHARRSEVAPLMDAFRRLSDRGVDCHFIHGNRDFHVGGGFARLGVRVHPTSLTLALPGGQRVYVCHGDTFCTADHRYQTMRRIIRSWLLRRLFRALPLAWREPLAIKMRGTSKREVASKTQRAMGLVDRDLLRCLAVHDAVVCGHVHREARRSLTTARGEGTVWTLGDWSDSKGSYLSWANGFRFGRFPRAE